jgi:hypothetical protein
MSYFERELPPGDLLKHPAWPTFRTFGVQWSQLIALFWCDNSSLTEDEKTLKSDFIQLLQKQAKNTEIHAKCDAPESLTPAEEACEEIKNLLLGDKNISGITLSELLEKYTTQPLMTTADESVKSMFKEMFYVRVITNSFVGKIIYAQGKDASSPDKDKYILELAYPPRPQLSDITITEEKLSIWANKPTDGSYEVPPSCYVPWCVC